MSRDEQDDRDSQREAQDQDLPLAQYLDAVNTVAAFIGGYEGERIRRALLDIAEVPEAPPPEQAAIQFDPNSIPY